MSRPSSAHPVPSPPSTKSVLPAGALEITEELAPLLLTLQVPASTRAAHEARHQVKAQVGAWNIPFAKEAMGDLLLCLMEVVTNAVLHAGTDSTVTLWWTGDRLRVEVVDGNCRRPQPRAATVGDPSGRGLAIVEELASRWGCERLSGEGKKVWFELDQAC